jgi:hypothetical protein
MAGMLIPVRAQLTPRTAATSVEELLVGATERRPLTAGDSKSGAALERVLIDGRPHVVKHLHPDHDWTMRGFGDLGCRPLRVWTSGLLDAVPACIDHAVVGAAGGLGRNGWGAALLMRDMTPHLVPEGDAIVPLAQHRQLIEHLAALSAAFWDVDPGSLPELLSLESRYSAFGPGWIAVEEARGFPEAVPAIAKRGWGLFAERAPADVAALVDGLRRDVDPLVRALRHTPLTLLHGDWKLGNLGVSDGRSVLLDWTYPGLGPVAHDLGWYLAINQAHLPESKEDTIEALRAALEAQGIATAPWWEAQLGLALLGTLVQFGWEKALGDDEELGWWCERARAGARWL